MDEEAEHETMYNEYKQHIIHIERYVYKLDQKVTIQTRYKEATYIKSTLFLIIIIFLSNHSFLSVFQTVFTQSNDTRREHTEMLLVYKTCRTRPQRLEATYEAGGTESAGRHGRSKPASRHT